ncbi:MAG TPA: OB-fold nucleic acid binding domain-containing protein [Actinocrinis sp.]|nr:OB-fold nucleic acid binding domain-containing protein [Actinocrinis sp.]
MKRASEDTATVTEEPAAQIGVQPPEKGRRGPLRRLLDRLSAETEELDAEELEAAIPAQGATPIAQCRDREPACIIGTLRTVTFRPRAGVPALEAELWDGTGSVTVIWLGRREIPGIDPGRTIKLRGRITSLRGRRAIYNPVYELRPRATD